MIKIQFTIKGRREEDAFMQMMEESGYKKPGTVARKEFEKWIEVYLKRKKLER